MVSGLIGIQVPGNRLRVRAPCPPLSEESLVLTCCRALGFELRILLILQSAHKSVQSSSPGYAAAGPSPLAGLPSGADSFCIASREI